MKRFAGAALAALSLVLFAVPALAQVSGAKFAAHIKAKAAKAAFICTSDSPNGTMTPCSSYNTQGLLSVGQDLYIVIANGDSNGLAGAEFGIDYNGISGEGVDIFGTEWCMSGLNFETDDWPAAGAGVRLTEVECQTTELGSDGAHAVQLALYVYAYSDDLFQVTEHRQLDSGPGLSVARCTGGQMSFEPPYLARTGSVGFGTNTGCNPCLEDCSSVPTKPSTWGRIKNQYGSGE